MPTADTRELSGCSLSFPEVAGFRGELGEIGFPSLLCLLETERKTGILVLILEPSLGKAFLYLSEGRVFRAHLSGRKEPRNAGVVYSLLDCAGGTFDFHPLDVVLDDEIHCSTTRLLVEGTRRMDEASHPPPVELMPVPGVDGLDIENRIPHDSPPPSRQAGTTSRKTEAGIRGWLGSDKGAALSDSSRRWVSAKCAVAVLLTASFVLLVLSAAITPR